MCIRDRTNLTLNGARIPDAAAARPGRCVAMLPTDYAPANSPFVLEGYAAFTQRGRQAAPGEAFSFAVELLPSPYARFVNCPRGLPPEPPCRPPSPPPCPPSPPPCPPSPPQMCIRDSRRNFLRHCILLEMGRRIRRIDEKAARQRFRAAFIFSL